jgi:hypothetical protein
VFAAGVPLTTPLAVLNVTPLGSAPLSLNVGAGEPVAVTVNEPAVPTVKVALLALVMAGARFTVWLRGGDVLHRKLVSPLYTAVMECWPTARVEMVHKAPPEDNVTPVQIAVVPSLKETVPVGVIGPCGVTFAVKVTDCPNAEGLADEVTAVVVVAWMPVPVRLTICGLVIALSAMVKEAVRVPEADGVKLMKNVHFPPVATELPHVLFSP